MVLPTQGIYRPSNRVLTWRQKRMRKERILRKNLKAFAIVCALALFIPAVGMIGYTFHLDRTSNPGSDTGSDSGTSVPRDPDMSWINFTTKDYLANLGIDPKEVGYYRNISEIFRLNSTQWDYISRNGFVVVDLDSVTTFEEAYEFYWENDLPVFITTDTILNTFHLLFDQFLKDMEKEVLGPLAAEMASSLLTESHTLLTKTSDRILGAALEDVVVFFGVAAKLMETGDDIPYYARNRVSDYVTKIQEARMIPPTEDYSQYEPRGHYAGDPYLEKYFRTMMWFGRKSYDVEKPAEVLRACLTSLILLSDEKTLSAWQRVYNFTTDLVGWSDSLNSYNMTEAMQASLDGTEIDLLTKHENVIAIQEELQKDMYYRQRILSDIVYKDPWEMYTKLEFPKIYQFMGQRYVPDSEIIQNVMYDRVPLFNKERRGLPSALDVMAAFGSARAVSHLKDELERYNYSRQLGGAIDSVKNKTEEYWNESAYFGLMRSYKELISGEEDDDYPNFMRTAAWADEKLNSALGSWTELKHDTILYAKPPYSIGITCSTPDGIVEPYPDFYSRMENLSMMMKSIAEEVGPGGSAGKRFAGVFEDFAGINRNLTRISIHELEGKPLTQEEVRFVRGVFVAVNNVCGGPKIFHGWLPDLIRRAGIEDKTKDTRIIADVATDPGTALPVPSPPKVLHVATGYMRSVIVAYEMPDGELQFFVGPVYSFYEFELTGFERLNDNEWKGLLDTDNRPVDPLWTSSFVA